MTYKLNDRKIWWIIRGDRKGQSHTESDNADRESTQGEGISVMEGIQGAFRYKLPEERIFEHTNPWFWKESR